MRRKGAALDVNIFLTPLNYLLVTHNLFLTLYPSYLVMYVLKTTNSNKTGYIHRRDKIYFQFREWNMLVRLSATIKK